LVTAGRGDTRYSGAPWQYANYAAPSWQCSCSLQVLQWHLAKPQQYASMQVGNLVACRSCWCQALPAGGHLLAVAWPQPPAVRSRRQLPATRDKHASTCHLIPGCPGTIQGADATRPVAKQCLGVSSKLVCDHQEGNRAQTWWGHAFSAYDH